MKIKIKNIYYYCLFIWLMANYAMRTGFSGINLHVIGIVYRGVTWGCIVLIIFRWLKYVNDGLITTKCFFLQSTILTISFLSFFKSGRDELLLAMIFIVGAINTERDKVFRIAYRASMLGTLIVSTDVLPHIHTVRTNDILFPELLNQTDLDLCIATAIINLLLISLYGKKGDELADSSWFHNV